MEKKFRYQNGRKCYIYEPKRETSLIRTETGDSFMNTKLSYGEEYSLVLNKIFPSGISKKILQYSSMIEIGDIFTTEIPGLSTYEALHKKITGPIFCVVKVSTKYVHLKEIKTSKILCEGPCNLLSTDSDCGDCSYCSISTVPTAFVCDLDNAYEEGQYINKHLKLSKNDNIKILESEWMFINNSIEDTSVYISGWLRYALKGWKLDKNIKDIKSKVLLTEDIENRDISITKDMYDYLEGCLIETKRV